MSDFVRSALASDIPPGTAKVFDVGGTPVAIFNAGGTYHAINNNCVHRMGPLAEGELEGTVVTCPWHGWRFDVSTGQCQNRPGAKVACYELRVEGDEIFVRV